MVLPVRDGLNPTRLVLPHDAQTVARHSTAAGYLLSRFPHDAARLRQKVAAGEVLNGRGDVITEQTPYEPRGQLYLYRDLVPEPEIPVDIPVLYRDENLLVVDKPHFLSTIPRGIYVTRSVLVRLRRQFDLPTLSPAHRLDRVTAGVLLFTVRPEVRGAYQLLFEKRNVVKEYEAVAPYDASLHFPVVVRSRIVKMRGEMAAREMLGTPNAESFIDLIEADKDSGLARYRLRPRTGKTHQLRVHMNRLGIPIVNDTFYPEILEADPEDYSAPLQLVARSLEFRDPLSGVPRRFVSGRELQVWAAHRSR